MKKNVNKKDNTLRNFDPLAAINPVVEAKESFNITLKLLISALTLVSALAWNEAIKAVFNYLRDLFPTSQGRVAETIALFLYALLVTVITVFAIRRLENLKKTFSKGEKEKPEKNKK